MTQAAAMGLVSVCAHKNSQDPRKNSRLIQIFYLSSGTRLAACRTPTAACWCARRVRFVPWYGGRFFSHTTHGGRSRRAASRCDVARCGRCGPGGGSAGDVTGPDRAVGRVAGHPPGRGGRSAARRCAGRVGVVSITGSCGEPLGPPRARRRSAPGNRTQSGAGFAVCQHRPRRRPRPGDRRRRRVRRDGRTQLDPRRVVW